MLRYVLTYGLIAGAVVGTLAGISMSILDADQMGMGETIGYLTMFAVLSLIFVGIKRYRDQECGGVISFAQAFGIGAAMSVVAAVAYALVWEISMTLTDHSFTAQYADHLIAEIRLDNISDAQKAERIADVQSTIQLYKNPAFRILVSIIEILPVALIVTLLSSLLLKNRKLLPAR